MYIADKDFIRGNCPMTKEEIRAISVSKLNVKPESRILDIGAGTGSVSIQISKLCLNGEVVAIEKDNEAIDLIYRNRNKFEAKNLMVIQGEALEVEKYVEPYFDGIFVGGSSGNIENIIKCYSNKLRDNGKMVLNFITLKNLNMAIEVLQSMNYDMECIQVSVNRMKGKSFMISSNNSIFIVTASRIGKEV